MCAVVIVSIVSDYPTSDTGKRTLCSGAQPHVVACLPKPTAADTKQTTPLFTR
jgi:hypothetical protein